MIINSLKLKNIRSYVDASLEFPNSTVLLSGDIGCGKTTILLAIEFAIFGIMKGLVAGSSLLRHGASNGFVELGFSLGKDNILIKRSLKRTSAGVAQESGTLIVNNNEFEGTPQELKARMLEMLGYPESLLNKSKSLIFRFTVFTPQEEMKRILYEKKEDRLDILRKLFNIDKYKRVKENSLNYIRELKNKCNVLQGKLEILPDKKIELENYTKQIETLKEKAEDKGDDLAKAKQEFDTTKELYEELEKQLDELKKNEKDFEVKKSEFQSATYHLERNEPELKRINEALEELLKGLAGFDASKAEEIKQRIIEKKTELKTIEEKLSDINSKRSAFKTKKEASQSITKKIADLDKCPTCEQKVTLEHARKVTAREQVIITKCDTNLATLDDWENKFREKKKVIEQEIDNYIQGERELEANKVKLMALEEKKERKKLLEKEISELKDKTTKLKFEIEELQAKLEKDKHKKTEFEATKKDLEFKREKKNTIEKIMLENKTRLDTITQMIEKIKSEIERLREDEKKLNLLNEIKNWMQTHLINLVDVIEKHILAKIYNEFNAFFQEWFNTLLEDETLTVRLDEYFSPVIEQNGYETWLENLSGGEKTSVALAYRLALNKVINDFLSSIKTRDLIILDEPTDGFSSEQLDRVREVLNQINVAQIIIVSHEAKMEGFVDSIIRIRKQGHESQIY
ncbi:MAG: AAA family ATPase [Nanoarchaeota archaeon]|nr:AAA family ATPase [Nanoarchaeota archaeon]MBU1322026.1 AAA family ATPase [Nanoarchaeota archaeon]MBU1598111.1 AAA family ATPase [Nanoarchaeota archaeon]MBU2441760.1 AAA family ATPase [Nanoarchaeota archaeon]